MAASLADVRAASREVYEVTSCGHPGELPLHLLCTPALALKRTGDCHWLVDEMQHSCSPDWTYFFFLQTSRHLRVKLPFGITGGRDLYCA